MLLAQNQDMNTWDRSRRLPSVRELDRGLVIGVGITLVLLIIGCSSGGSALNFFHLNSFLLVIGGTIGATLIHFSMQDLRYAWEALRAALASKPYDPDGRIRYLVKMAQLVRASGPMVLEREARGLNDQFLKKAFELAVDNQLPEEMRRMLETEMRTSHEHATSAVQVFETMGSYAPALGLIGTIMGLIQMLGALSDPATVGPAMALALLTTFYGAILASLICLPLAGKLRKRLEEEATLKALSLEGALGLNKQENAVILEQRLQSYLPKSELRR